MNALGTTAPETDPEVQRWLEESQARLSADLAGREFRLELFVALALLGAAACMAALLPADGSLDVGLAIGLTVTYALAARVRFHIGAGWAVPTQLVLVPMLFLVPAPAVPLLVATGFMLSNAPDYLSGTIRPTRWVIDVGDAWHAVGPALVLALAGADGPSWADWPIYLAALMAEFVCDLARNLLRGKYTLALRIRLQVSELGSAYVVDALLSPVGLLVAFAAVTWQWAYLLVLPLLVLIAIFAREREARIESAQVLSRAYRGTAHLMAELLTTSHEYTGNHSRSVVVLAHQVGELMGLEERTLREIEFGALLHDIGKLSVPNEIINKPGALSQEEMALMRTHTLEGERMLGQIGGVLAEVGQVVRTHHEHFDGHGYPDGLSGHEIPIGARVISCCDAFSAMTSDRSYRAAMPLDDAIAELRAHSGTQFDPQVVDALISIVDKWDRPTRFADQNGAGRELTPVSA